MDCHIHILGVTNPEQGEMNECRETKRLPSGMELRCFVLSLLT